MEQYARFGDNAHPYDPATSKTFYMPANIFVRLLLTALASTISGCGEPPTQVAGTPPTCGAGGALFAEIYGGIRASIDWDASELDCEGMPRPNGDGARLRFSGQVGGAPDARRIAFILGLPDLVQGETGSELSTNVTVIEEGSGRFFGTQGAAVCWTDVVTQQAILPMDSSVYSISGILYCLAPLANLNGNSSISFTDLTFSGRLNWETP